MVEGYGIAACRKMVGGIEKWPICYVNCIKWTKLEEREEVTYVCTGTDKLNPPEMLMASVNEHSLHWKVLCCEVNSLSYMFILAKE